MPTLHIEVLIHLDPISLEPNTPNIAFSSTTMFVSSADNVNYENNESKTEIASENIDKSKSILGAPLWLKRKTLESLRLRR